MFYKLVNIRVYFHIKFYILIVTYKQLSKDFKFYEHQF